MNKLETEYAALLELRRQGGEILWYAYEVVKFRLAKATFYMPDFLVMFPSGALEAHEVKAWWEDDARVKMKVAAQVIPIQFVAVMGNTKKGWTYEYF